MGVGVVRSLQPPDTLWIHWRVYNFVVNTSKRVLFLPPSDAYVRSFLYLYYTKALSDQASSLAPDWILLFQRPRIPVSFCGWATTFHCHVKWVQLHGSLNSLWHCTSLGLWLKRIFSRFLMDILKFFRKANTYIFSYALLIYHLRTFRKYMPWGALLVHCIWTIGSQVWFKYEQQLIGLLKYRFLDPFPNISDSLGHGWGEIICISHSFRDDTNAAALGITLWESLT